MDQLQFRYTVCTYMDGTNNANGKLRLLKCVQEQIDRGLKIDSCKMIASKM